MIALIKSTLVSCAKQISSRCNWSKGQQKNVTFFTTIALLFNNLLSSSILRSSNLYKRTHIKMCFLWEALQSDAILVQSLYSSDFRAPEKVNFVLKKQVILTKKDTFYVFDKNLHFQLNECEFTSTHLYVPITSWLWNSVCLDWTW